MTPRKRPGRRPATFATAPAQAKVEAYAAARAAGKTIAESAIAAGYARARAKKTGEEIEASPVGRAAIAAARARVTDAVRARSVADADRIREELEAVGLADITDLFEEDEDGIARLKKLRDWPVEARRAVAGVKVRRVLEGGRLVEVTEFKLWPKLPALAELAALQGLKKAADLNVTLSAGAGTKRILIDLEGVG